jgi:hypothetical protein
MFQISSYEFDLTCLLFTKYEAKKNSTPQAQLPQAQVLGELVMEPINKALQEENGRLKTYIEVLKEREICKQELMDEYKKNVEVEIQRSKDEIQRVKEENQRFRDEVSSLKEKEIRLTVENDFLKQRDEDMRLERNTERVERTADRAMFQSMISSLMNGAEDRKRKRNDEEETK